MTGPLVPEPKSRLLRIFPFDPSIGSGLTMDRLSEITISIPWEDDLKKGPVGEYLAVVDADPASSSFYRPVDLNDHRILAQNGLSPTEANPQFHQQMVYAVAMATIGHFEAALGRVALWSSYLPRDENGEVNGQEQFVRRLRIYPHALRDRNAYYSPEKKALLFGYFPAGAKGSSPGTLVFTCLSHDIIAHEMAHALLDGVHPRFTEPMNVDVLAFHEAFADLVALFQRFSYPGVLREEIERTRGDLGRETMLAQLAQQFGRATGRGSALRDALGKPNARGVWEPNLPRPDALRGVTEPHQRGAILVAAVFGAFMKVYRARTADLYRIASGGTGVLDDGAIHPDLTGRLAEEASDCARTVLRMCIRAIDYCPPVGISFGDFLRGIITADFDEAPVHGRPYRLAFNESFREWGIYPREARGVAVESLLWPTLDQALEEPMHSKDDPRVTLKEHVADRRGRVMRQSSEIRKGIKDAVGPIPATRDISVAGSDNEETPDFTGDEFMYPALSGVSRYSIWADSERAAKELHNWLHNEKNPEVVLGLGIVTDADPKRMTIFRNRSDRHSVEVHSVRMATRINDKGWAVPDLVVEITQRRRGYFDPDIQKARDADGNFGQKPRGDFIFRSGVTLLINPATMAVRRVIRSAGRIDDDDALERTRWYLTRGASPPDAFASPSAIAATQERFALLHRHHGAPDGPESE